MSSARSALWLTLWDCSRLQLDPGRRVGDQWNDFYRCREGFAEPPCSRRASHQHRSRRELARRRLASFPTAVASSFPRMRPRPHGGRRDHGVRRRARRLRMALERRLAVDVRWRRNRGRARQDVVGAIQVRRSPASATAGVLCVPEGVAEQPVRNSEPDLLGRRVPQRTGVGRSHVAARDPDPILFIRNSFPRASQGSVDFTDPTNDASSPVVS